MFMVNEFDEFVKQHQLVARDQKILVAVSGGRDSVVLLDLLCKSGYKVAIAHCNFQLRGEESNADEAFVRRLAIKYKIPVFVRVFDTSGYAEENNLSIQMAARDLRYHWFQELCKHEVYDLIATAHHQDDHIETVLINMLRGTGISGLHGILPKRNNIIRPILFASREAVDQYVDDHKLSFREDSTNISVKYLRNKLRHEVIPHLKEINPMLGDTFWGNSQRFLAAERIYKLKIEELEREICQNDKGIYKIDISKLSDQEYKDSILFDLISPFGFTIEQVKDVLKHFTISSGKLFYSERYELLVDRIYILVRPKKEKKSSSCLITEDSTEFQGPIKLNLQKQPFDDNFVISTEPWKAMVDAGKLNYPLVLRKWEKGDFFYPLGMKGKKLLSDFFIDRKIPVFEKEKTWILESAGEIVWVIGHRIDNRYKLNDQTKEVLVIEIEN